MLGNKRDSSQSSAIAKTLGPTAVRLLAVNPDANKLEQIYNRAPKVDPDYSIITKNGVDYRPVFVYLQNVTTKAIYSFRINVGPAVVGTPIGANGEPRNYKIVTADGSVTWAGKKENGTVVIKPQFENHQPLRVGEDVVIAMVQAFTDYNPNKDTGFVADATNMRLMAEHLYAGDYSGFNILPETYPLNQMIVVLTVTENGDKTYQNVAVLPELFFSDKYGSGPNDYHAKRIQQIHTQQLTNGRDIFEGCHYSYIPSVYVPDVSMGGVPKNPQATQANWND